MDQHETIDVSDLDEWLRLPTLADTPPIEVEFDDDVMRYKLRFAYAPVPMFLGPRYVPCRCSRWRTRIARFLGRHPRMHRLPSVLVTSI